MDKVSIAKLNTLHPAIRMKSIAAYNLAISETPKNVHPYIVEANRSFAISNHDYELGRTVVNPDGRSENKPFGNIITNAKGGYSWHNYGLAFDFGLIVNGNPSYKADKNWLLVVAIFEKIGYNWGGNFAGDLEDTPHLEIKMGYTINQLLAKYHAKDFIPGTGYLNLKQHNKHKAM